jgi:hypothetical protein
MTHNWMRCLVPREWSPDEALLAVNLLRQAMDAVWGVHGEDMAAALAEDRYRDKLGDYVDTDEVADVDLDDLPF